MIDYLHMTPLIIAFVFTFGAIIGSFTNAVLWRLRTGETVLHGRSYCPSCKHTLGPADLIPLLSYLALGGKCRHCEAEIGAHYLWVELGMGVLYVAATFAVMREYGPAFGGIGLAALLLHWYFMTMFVIIFVYDWRYMLILRKVTLPATIIAVIANLALAVPPTSIAIGMLVGWGFFAAQYAVSKGRWVGGGDPWLGLLMGAVLGWPLVALALFMAYIGGALVGSVLLLTRRAHMQSQLAFGTFLSVAAVVTLLYGDRILVWYLTLLA